MVLTPKKPKIESTPSRLGTLCCGYIPAHEPSGPAVWEALPSEAEFILSALEAASAKVPERDRRKAARQRFRAVVKLKLFTDGPGAEPWVLFARDVTTRAMGFITRHRLPLGYGGVATLCGPADQEVIADCTLLRCRETVSDWFEGSLAFNREQWAFEEV